MRAKFWQCGLGSIIGMSIGISAELSIAILGIILTIKNIDFWFLIVFGGFLTLICVPVFIGMFREVVLTEEGIELKFGKKRLSYLYWTDINNVKITSLGKGGDALTFLEDDKKIDIVLMPKTFNAFMDICPDIGIKYQVEEFPAVQSLMKRYLKKKDDSHKNK